MAPTLRDGQLALTRSWLPAHPLRRGDLVVAEVTDPARRVVPRVVKRVLNRVVKRVVGLPGERVSIRGGAVAADGVALDEPYASPSVFRGDFEVPPGHYLLLGDNRDASEDARSWSRPYVAEREIVGRLVGGAARRRP
jgi:signal peptidase I